MPKRSRSRSASLGFDEVVELYDKDASVRRLQQTLRISCPARLVDMIAWCFILSGHAGVTQDLAGKELGYLVPWDAQIGNVSKSVTFEQLKEFSRRIASKHTLFFLNAAVRGWEVSTRSAPVPRRAVGSRRRYGAASRASVDGG